MGPTIAVIGSGFGGIGVGIALKRAGLHDFTIYEQAGDLGGVWRDNTYPGAACDVPSPLYSYSFTPHATWPNRYGDRDTIHRYLATTVDNEGLYLHFQYNTEITQLEYDQATAKWTLHTRGGATHRADLVITAVGQLSKPSWPNIPGMDTFTGPTMHSATWDHNVDLTGKRVAVIGSGASAIQFVPQIQPVVASLNLFQRTPPYVLPKPDRTYRDWHQAMFRYLPITKTAGRFGIWATGEAMTTAITSVKPLAALLTRACLTHLRLRVTDPDLRAKLTPGHAIGCKRILFSNDYFPALTQPNVTVTTDPIARITPTGLRTADGVDHRADVIIYGTGFRANDFLAPITITGRDDTDLDTQWSDGARAYLGMAIPHFPNLFLMYGPNTNLGGGSIIYMLERQARYITHAATRLAALGPGSSLEIREDIADAFDTEIQQHLARSVWAGCANWYTHPSGRITTNWPGLVTEYDRRTRIFDPIDYHEKQAGTAPDPNRIRPLISDNRIPDIR